MHSVAQKLFLDPLPVTAGGRGNPCLTALGVGGGGSERVILTPNADSRYNPLQAAHSPGKPHKPLWMGESKRRHLSWPCGWAGGRHWEGR